MASGLIAGGGIAGVVAAFVLLARSSWEGGVFDRLMAAVTIGYDGVGSNILSLVLFTGLCCWIYWDVKRTKSIE